MVKFNPGLSQILSKVFLSSLQNTVVSLLRDSVMITQNVTLSNAQEGKYKIWNKIFNPGLALIGLSGTGARGSFLESPDN